MKTRSLTACLAMLAIIFTGAPVIVFPAFSQMPPAPVTMADKDIADVPLQVEIFEPFVKQLFSGTINVPYKANLDRDGALEIAIPGIHSAMIEKALRSGAAVLEAESAKAKRDARQALRGSVKPHEIERLMFLYGPLVKANANKYLVFQSGDTASTAVDRWLGLLGEDPEYQTRLKKVTSEPGMLKALNVAAPIMKNYQDQLDVAARTAVQAGISAAKNEANAIATAKGYDSPYPGVQ